MPRGQRARPVPMAERPGRQPEQPYVDHRGSVASLARHLRMGLDLAHPTTSVNTHELALILDTMLGIGFGGDRAQQFQADLQTAAAAAMAAQEERAEKAEAEDAGNG
jgi:hypothetical protein